jgi:hypothetical protein
MSTSHALTVAQTQTLYQIEHALRNYFELEAASLIANGEAYRNEMKEAESHVIGLLTRIGGKVTIGNCTVSAHESFEGERKTGAWFVCHGPTNQFSDAANTAAHTRLLTPWRHGLWIDPNARKAS